MTETQWVVFGIVFQGFFLGRFLVQWIASERAKKSVIPVSFWFLSIAGAGGLLTYAIHKQDPVFIIGQSTGLFIYLRNLTLIKRTRAEEAAKLLQEQADQEPALPKDEG